MWTCSRPPFLSGLKFGELAEAGRSWWDRSTPRDLLSGEADCEADETDSTNRANGANDANRANEGAA